MSAQNSPELQAADCRRHSPSALLDLAREVLRVEADAVTALVDRIGDEFMHAANLLLECSGRVVVLGMGKSGHIGSKLAATLASTGTPAFFIHPGEASHGDLGMVTAQDVVIALSNSGETDELLVLLPIIKRLGVPLVALTGEPDSTLAQAAAVHLDVSVEREACPLGLAPTASTTAAIAMGDALAICLLEARGFGAEDFARSHPGGRLGRRLLLRIEDVAHVGAAMPCVARDRPLTEVLVEMSAKGLGLAVIADGDRLIGVFTDGDLRRCVDAGRDLRATEVGAVMTSPCRHVQAGALAAEALALMQQHKVNALPVLSGETLIGVINMHDLLRAGVL